MITSPTSNAAFAAWKRPRSASAARHALRVVLAAGSALAASAALASVSGPVPLVPVPAPAITFDFNVPASSTAVGLKLTTVLGASNSSGLGATARPNVISAYMTAVLHAAGYGGASVVTTGGLGTATYVGENYVWGNSLGSSNGAVYSNPNTTVLAEQKPFAVTGGDGFLINDNFARYGKASPEIKMTFTNFAVDSISYDWEIFPDVTCPSSSKCTALPDMSVYANKVLVPGSSFNAVMRSAGEVNNKVYAPQAIGTITSPLMLNGATTLEFFDWPAEIGIDNLRITGHAVPEPASLPLLATGLLGLGWLLRRRQQVQAAPALQRIAA
jgi:hypothetical protein